MTAPAACLAGEYQDNTGSTACIACPAGKYCDRQGLSAISGSCPAGFYCRINQVNFHEFMCPLGYSCLVDSTDPTECPVGKYCDRERLGVAPNDCLAGYYCDETQSTEPNPSGKTCPRGSYCPAGSTNFVQCAIGTYNEKLGSSSSSDCLNCPDGKICDELGLVSPKDTCPATQYCTGSTPADCTLGHYCPAGFDYPIACQPGTFQNQTAQDTCQDCPEGYYCDTTLDTNAYQPRKCPPGYYCPAKSIHYGLYPCPRGRFGAATVTPEGLTALNNCTSCTENFF